MRFDTSQSMKLGQHMKLAPRMIQSMEILQMPLAELQERIEQELESNIALELAAGSTESTDADRPADNDIDSDRELDAGESSDDFARLDDYEADHPDATENEYSSSRATTEPTYDPSYSPASRYDPDNDPKGEAMANAPARSASLHDQLFDQWSLVEIDESLRPLGRLLIEKLDSDGYLRTPLEDIARDAPHTLQPVDPADLEQALTAVQLFLEPPGIAARDARECLLLQLDALEEDADAWSPADDRTALVDTARAIVEDHLDDLMNNRLPRIAERTGRSLDDIKSALQILRRLSLAPARRLIHDAPEPIIPDAIVEYDPDADRYFAYLNESRLPNLLVNREYAKMARDRSLEKRDRDFIRTNLANASWLIEALDQRRKTILRVIDVVLDEQREFFDRGPEALKPLPMTQVAEQLGIHVATVSRAVSDKHLMTPRGIVPLRRFFTGGLQTESGEDLSYDAVRAALKDVIDAEDKSKPLSDEALVNELKERGIEIARRTVAKYRSQLGVPSARLRKQH